MRAMFLALCLLPILACSDGSDKIEVDGSGSEQAERAVEFIQVGYFKDSNKNRIYTYSYPPGVNDREILSHATSLMYTQGRLMSVYYWPEEAPIPSDDVTIAKNTFYANQAIDAFGGYTHVFVRNLNGTKSFANCETTPNQGLCKPQ